MTEEKQVIFLVHCFLIANTRFPGGGCYGGVTIPFIEKLLKSEVGIIQGPCPEFLCLGLEEQLYGQLSERKLRKCYRKIAEGVAEQIRAYLDLGYEILGIIGMNPSSSCGVKVTRVKKLLGPSKGTSEVEGVGILSRKSKN